MSWGVICMTPFKTVSAVGTAPARSPCPSPGSPSPKPGAVNRLIMCRFLKASIAVSIVALPTGEPGVCVVVGVVGVVTFTRRMLPKFCFSSASSSLYGRHTAWMGSLACEVELERAGRALRCAMTLPAVFGSKSSALTFFVCALVTRSRDGETTPPSSVSCPTMRERTIKADCNARRSACESAGGFARSVDAAVGAAASCFSPVRRAALSLRSNLKCPRRDQRRRSVFGVRVAETGCPVTATEGALDSLAWETCGGSDVGGGAEAPLEVTGSSESGVLAGVVGASVGFLSGASSALCICDGVAVDLSRALMRSNKAMLRTKEGVSVCQSKRRCGAIFGCLCVRSPATPTSKGK